MSGCVLSCSLASRCNAKSRSARSYLILRHSAEEARAPDVLADLPPLLRSRVARHLHLPVLSASPIFVGCTQSFLDHIACRLRFELFTPSVDLVAAGDVGGLEISWLVSGTADVLAARPEEEEEGFHEADEMRSEEGTSPY